MARYYFSISRTEKIPTTWKWTIQRKNKPLAVKLESSDFKSKGEAIQAAEKALEELMIAMAEAEQAETGERRRRGRPRL